MDITDPGTWPRANATALHLREQLRGVLTEAEVRAILPMGDIGDGEHVRLGTISLESAERLLTRLLQPATATAWCSWHRGTIPAADSVPIAAMAPGSSPNVTITACTACTTAHDLLPLTEHPASSDGTARCRDGQPAYPIALP